MPVFTYRGTNRAGSSISGELTANNKTELANLLRRQQITVTKMSEKGKEFNLPTFGGGVSPKELAIFTRQFSVMIDAGLPLVQCLEILAGQQENKTFQKALIGVRSSVEGGATLSTSMIFNVTVALMIMIAGHLVGTAREMWSGSALARWFLAILPDLGSFNIADDIILGNAIPWAHVGKVVLYGLVYLTCVVAAAHFIFSDREI